MEELNQESGLQVPEAQIEEQSAPRPPDADWTVESIIAELEREFDGILQVDAIRAAQKRHDEVIPHLIKLVERATALARDGEFPNGNGHLIAVYLLTEFRAKQALPAIVDAVSLSFKEVDELFGDAISADFCRVFAVLAADAPEQVDALIANRSFSVYVRWAAAQTYLLWVRDGRLTREQAAEKLRQHLRGAIANRDRELTGSLVCELDSYVPREAMDDIREAYREGLADESIICLDEIEDTLAEGDAHWREELANCRPTEIEDTIEELQEWWCYRGDGDDEFDESGFADDDVDDEYEEDFARAIREKMRLPPSLLDDPSMLNDDEFRMVWNTAKSQVTADIQSGDNQSGTHSETIRRTEPRVGRNEPCPCGSGKKFKKCCGKH